MWRADAGQAPGNDFAAFRDELSEQPHVLVIDRFYLLGAELANFLAPEILAACSTAAFSPAATGP
jgi:hypothetical protein